MNLWGKIVMGIGYFGLGEFFVVALLGAFYAVRNWIMDRRAWRARVEEIRADTLREVPTPTFEELQALERVYGDEK